MIHKSLRGRVALAAACATAVVILIGGGLVIALVSRNERQNLDQRLAEQSIAVQRPILGSLSGGGGLNPLELAARRPDVGTVIRVYSNNELALSIGKVDVSFPTPKQNGFHTVQAGGESWRVQTSAIGGRGLEGNDIVLQTAVPTKATDQLVDSLRTRTFAVALFSSFMAGVAGWFLGQVALRPLARLRVAAETVSTSRDLSVRVPAPDKGPTEVADLAHSLNVMLERLQDAAASTEAALKSSREFAGNAAHEMRTPLTSMQANLDVLLANPDLPSEQADEITAAINQEQLRLVRLLDALHTLARGDVVGEAQRDITDVADLAAIAVGSARSRFPSVEYSFDVPDESTEIAGWADGLRVMIDNLLTNAARHGATRVNVALAKDPENGDLSLTVDDNGPGVPEEERSLIFDRFYRGKSTTSSGSGLGLALVAQQARIHGGDVTVSDSSLGGARFLIRLGSAN